MATSQWWKGKALALVNSTTAYIIPIAVLRTNEDSEISCQIPIGTAGSILTFRVRLSAAPGVGKSYTFALSVNQAASALFYVTIADTATSGIVTGTLAISKDDALSIRKTPSGAPTSVDAEFDIEFLPTTANYYCYFGHTDNPGGGSHSVKAYRCLTNAAGLHPNSPPQAQCVFPLDGTLRSFSVLLRERPDSSIFNGARGLTFNQNGVNVGSTITIETSRTGTLTGLSTAITAGDLLCVEDEPLFPHGGLGPVQNTRTAFCLVIEPTTAGEFAWMSLKDTQIDDFVSISGGSTNVSSDTESAERLAMPGPFLLGKFYFANNSASTPGATETFTVRKNGVDTTQAIVVTGAQKTGHDIVHQTTVADGDLISIGVVDSGSPTVADDFTFGITFTPIPNTPPSGGGGGEPARQLMSPFNRTWLTRVQRDVYVDGRPVRVRG